MKDLTGSNLWPGRSSCIAGIKKNTIACCVLRQQAEPAQPVMSDFEMFSQFMMVFSLVIAAVTIGYAIGRKK